MREQLTANWHKYLFDEVWIMQHPNPLNTSRSPIMKMMILFLLFQFSNFALCRFSRTLYNGTETDQLSLLDIKKGLLDGSSQDAVQELNSWNASLHFCQWHGITCAGRQQKVTRLELVRHGFGGTLSPSVGNLTFLKILNLCGNKLRGIIPKEIGLLSRLEAFNVSRNNLEGPVLLHLSNCTELFNIDLSRNNRVIDTIPFQIGFLSKLEIFVMGQTNLTGKIPSSIGNLSRLRDLSLYYTYLQGSIPSEIGKLKQMTRLDFTLNRLSGTVPLALYKNLSNIREISFTGNGLSGRIPPTLGVDFPRLRLGYFGINNFTGGVPPTISNMSNLQGIDLSSNQLEGNIPEGLGSLNNLSYLNLGINNLGSGEADDLDFIGSLANLSSLSYLSLSQNKFGGVIPASVGNLSSMLEQLLLGSNNIYGSIPVELGNLANLISLGIENNHLSGDIPTSMGKLRKLGDLDLSVNKLNGSIPLFFGNLTDLNTLLLYNNQLNGQIPSTLKYCSRLQSLSLNGNRLSGIIPGEIMSGLNSLLKLRLNGNSFTGSFPNEVGNLAQLSLLDISRNKFTGNIPDELGRCLMLEILKMGENNFSGSIPLSFSAYQSARIIDLSSNNLTGSIPMELQGLYNLQTFNASFNQLEGEVPIKGPFANLSAIYLQGNKRLCGGLPQLGLARCLEKKTRKGKQQMSTKAVIGIAVSLSALLVFAVVLVCFLRRKGSKTTVPLSIPSKKSGTFPRLTYKELLKATDEFSTRNLIGVGSYGLVYKGALKEDKNLIAVKVMNLANSGAVKSFLAECKVLSRVRHRNLLQILSYCSSLDFKGNDFMALVFEFMPNGNLDTWLHVSKNLKLSQRVDIAIDIASALDYLHHHSEPQVVHCDLKPSNVLLDSNMVAHVGDFGLAKLVHGTVTDDLGKGQSSTMAVKGTVGYVPPEYGMGGNVSSQGDVYSYGILLLEMITGKRPTDEMFRDGVNLHSLCSSAVSKSSSMEILDLHLLEEMDISLKNEGNEASTEQTLRESVASIIEIGIACSVENPHERIDTRHALNVLHKIKAKLLQFNQRSVPPFPHDGSPSS